MFTEETSAAGTLPPVVILTGAIGIALGIGSYFAAATLARSGDKTLKFSLYGSTNQMLFMALPERMQKTARTLSGAIVRPATFIFAGLLLIFVTQGAGMSDAAVGWFTGAMALIWITLSVTAQRRYLVALLNLLAQNRIKLHTDKIEITDRDAIGQVRSLLASDDAYRIVNGLEIAKRIKGVDMIPDVMQLTRHADARVRAAAAAYLGEMGGSSELGRLWELIGDSDLDVRGPAAQAVFRLSDASVEDLDLMRPYLDSPDLPVRTADLSYFLSSERDDERRLGDDVLMQMAKADDPESRLAAEERIERWLRHDDPWRSTAALWTTGNARLQWLREKVRGHLESEHAVVRETAVLAAWNIEDPVTRREILEPLRGDPVSAIRQLVTTLLDNPKDAPVARPA